MIDDNQKYLRQPEHPYPHIGKMMLARLRKTRLTQADVSRQLGVNQTVVTRYFRQQSVQFGVLWKVGLALKHNFLAELSDHFPHPGAPDTATEKAIAERDARIADLEKELAIYKSIVMAGRGG